MFYQKDEKNREKSYKYFKMIVSIFQNRMRKQVKTTKINNKKQDQAAIDFMYSFILKKKKRICILCKQSESQSSTR